MDTQVVGELDGPLDERNGFGVGRTEQPQFEDVLSVAGDPADGVGGDVAVRAHES